jgi:hypothetical protein
VPQQWGITKCASYCEKPNGGYLNKRLAYGAVDDPVVIIIAVLHDTVPGSKGCPAHVAVPCIIVMELVLHLALPLAFPSQAGGTCPGDVPRGPTGSGIQDPLQLEVQSRSTQRTTVHGRHDLVPTTGVRNTNVPLWHGSAAGWTQPLHPTGLV